MRHRSNLLLTAFLALGLTTACDDDGAEVIDAEPDGEGVLYDAEHPDADVEGAGKADTPETYAIPALVPHVVRPEIIVSLRTRTVHLFDRSTGASMVYPTGPGKLGSSGRSWTPNGFFETWHDVRDPWGYIERRVSPDYFGGFPFLRLNARNSRGETTYGFHGPITYTCPGGGSSCSMLQRQWFLIQDYVSSGCMRMEAEDIVEMFWAMRHIPRVPVAIIDDYERDAVGNVVDLGARPVLWRPGDAIHYGECGTRADPWETGGWPSPQRCR